MNVPECDFYTRQGYAFTFGDWVDHAEIDTTGLVASLTVPPHWLWMGDDVSHFLIANIHYDITKQERTRQGVKLWLNARQAN